MLCYGAKHREPVVPKDIAMYVTDRSGSVLFLEIQLCLWVLKKKMIITVCVKLQYKGFSFSYYDMIGVISCMMPD